MENMQAAVRAFHRKFGRPVRQKPGFGGINMAFRYSLMREELEELHKGANELNLVAVADGLADLLYVTLGTAVELGIDLEPIFNAVHTANMAKEGGAVREDGKVLKPPGWVAPEGEIEEELIRQGWRP